MATTDPKKLAAAILKARGTAKYDDLIVSTFEALAKAPEVAWKVLALADERACIARAKRKGSTFFEREVRVLGRVVAWRESRVTMSRDTLKPGALSLEIISRRDIALLRAEDIADDKRVAWGERLGAGEPQDTKAHEAERARILKSGDVAKLKAYRKRYEKTSLLSSLDARQIAIPIWQTSAVLAEAVENTDDVKVIKLLLDDSVEEWAIQHALRAAILAKRPKAFALLLPKLKDLNAEPLLALAVQEGAKDMVLPLIEAGADPNAVKSPWGTGVGDDEQDGYGPMVNAVRNGDEAMLKVLLAHGGNPSVRTNAGRALPELAKERKNKKVIALLDAAQKKAPPMDMATALANGNVARVLELMPIEGARWPLVSTAQEGKVDLLRAVLESKVKGTPEELSRALYFGIQGGEEVVKLLLAHGADPNLYNDGSMGTVLAFAQYTKRTAIVALLKKAGAKVRVAKKN